jgi:diphthamide synthase subunit DPH2
MLVLLALQLNLMNLKIYPGALVLVGNLANFQIPKFIFISCSEIEVDFSNFKSTGILYSSKIVLPMDALYT